MAIYTKNLSLVNPTSFVNDENTNAPVKEVGENVEYILNFMNGNKALLAGIYGNLWDYDRDGRRLTINGGKFDTFKKANSFVALNNLQVANDDEIVWDSAASRVVYKGLSDQTSDREKWIEKEVWIPEALRDQKLILAIKASGCTTETGWTEATAVCETIGIQILGGDTDVQDFKNVGKWENHLYYSNDSYGAKMTTVIVPFKASKTTKSVKIKILRTVNENYLHIDKMFVGGLCTPYENDEETYKLYDIDINEFFDYVNVCTKVISTGVLGHKVADERHHLRGNDLMTWYQFNYVMREILTYGSVYTTSRTADTTGTSGTSGSPATTGSSGTSGSPATTGASGSPSDDNWSLIDVLPLYGNLQGTVVCNTTERVYRVNHPVLENPSTPVITLKIPTMESQVFAMAVFEVETDHFYITLSDIPSEEGYEIHWTLGNAFSPREAIDALDLPNETESIECAPATVYPQIFNYESNA
jgi:hypothetical protein